LLRRRTGDRNLHEYRCPVNREHWHIGHDGFAVAYV
jgi:hypothetical protein